MSIPPEDVLAEELLPEDLRDLRLGRPRGALRQDTLRALRLALDEPPRVPRWWEPWRVELTLGVITVAACCVLVLCLGSPACQLPETLFPVAPPPVVASTPMAAELEDLGPYATRAHRALHLTERRADHAVLTPDDLDQI